MRYFVTIYFLIIVCVGFGQSLDRDISAFFKSVLYIKGNHPEKATLNGKSYDVILRDVETGKEQLHTTTSTGTGFLVESFLDVYLVTAEHVARDSYLNTTILFSDEENNPIQISLKEIIPKGKMNWSIHNYADVAVHKIDMSKLPESAKVSLIPIGLMNFDIQGAVRNRELTVYGYPLSLGISPKVSPISKTLKPASDIVEINRGDTNKPSLFFLLDDPSIGGFSGGPVMALPQYFDQLDGRLFINVYRLMGLVHGTVNDQNGGFAAVVPSFFIKETIERAPGYTGSYKYKYPNGEIWSECVFKNGIPWTVISNFSASGMPQDPGSLKEGNGVLKRYYENGDMYELIEFVNGQMIDYKHFPKGKVSD